MFSIGPSTLPCPSVWRGLHRGICWHAVVAQLQEQIAFRAFNHGCIVVATFSTISCPFFDDFRFAVYACSLASHDEGHTLFLVIVPVRIDYTRYAWHAKQESECHTCLTVFHHVGRAIEIAAFAEGVVVVDEGNGMLGVVMDKRVAVCGERLQVVRPDGIVVIVELAWEVEHVGLVVCIAQET